MTKIKNKRAISLIVLVITVIVMIILAGAIILSLRDTGVIDRASEAVKVTNEAQAKNLAATLWTDAHLDDKVDKSEKTEEYYEKAVREGLEKAGVDPDIYLITVTTYGVTLKLPTIGDLVTSAANYGDTVNYSANGVDNWKVFYKQKVDGQEYVYLIASEPIPNESIPTKFADTVENGGANAVISGNTISWTSVPSKVAQGEINADLWLAKWSNYDNGKTNTKCLTYFLDESYWTAFKSAKLGTDVVGAIGTPTMEMFVASWNEKADLPNEITNQQYTKLTLTENEMGYMINNNKLQDIKTTDNLYVWSTDESEVFCWLASPGGDHTAAISLIRNTGRLYRSTYNVANGIRPVVCIKATTYAHAGETTDIVLDKMQ